MVHHITISPCNGEPLGYGLQAGGIEAAIEGSIRQAAPVRDVIWQQQGEPDARDSGLPDRFGSKAVEAAIPAHKKFPDSQFLNVSAYSF